MSAGIFNIAKGRIIARADEVVANSPINSDFFITMYEASESSTTLVNRLTKTEVDTQAGNTVALFDNYVDQYLTGTSVGTLGNEVFITANDTTIVTAGSTGAGVDSTLVRVIMYHTTSLTVTGAAVPMLYFDFPVITNGTDLTFKVPASGLFRIG